MQGVLYVFSCFPRPYHVPTYQCSYSICRALPTIQGKCKVRTEYTSYKVNSSQAANNNREEPSKITIRID